MEPVLKHRRLPSVILASGAAVAMMLAGLGIAAAQTDDTPPPSTTTAPPEEERKGAEGEGGDEKRRHGERGHCHKGHHGLHAAVAAKALGMTAAELKAEFEAGRSIADVAKAKGVDVAVVIDALVADAKARMAEGVAAGKLTQAQADARSADLVERITAMVNAPRPLGDHDGEGGHKRGRPGPHGTKPHLGAAAEILGLTPEELRTQLQAGKSLAAIAAEKDVDVQKLIDGLVAKAVAKLDDAVANSRITQAQADAKKAGLADRITAAVNATPQPGRARHHRGPGEGGPAETEATTQAEPAILQS